MGSDKRFSGYDKTKGEMDAEAHRSRYIAEGIGADDLEDMYLKVHEAIRADPKARDPVKNAADRKKAAAAAKKPRDWRKKDNMKYTLTQRKHRAFQKLNKIREAEGLEPRVWGQ